ncbi:DNA-binding domain-containing protein [Marilutibacter chinensis]|uniref:DNA-binding domain-containing protein n=1 Tax=Marilutibacter chinensis TaxID=2912247 RepID=A0ABS9HWR4_9GAMM|nr:putative DNA-binding domain-containing protein [Lysobacter chinensis]MCF7222634.1 putative DNA-binding domain-containing protein [Lysobacter chinensis]
MPEDTPRGMPAVAPPQLRAQQFELTRHLRDPDGTPAPKGIEPRRLKVYRELLFNNIESLLAGNFPVIRRILGDDWPSLVRRFYREHRCQTPLFPEIAREFLRFLETRPETGPPWLAELAHYEWVELALQIAEARADDVEADPDGDLLEASPVLSPLAWPLAYRWPVHRLGPDHLPQQPPDTPTLLMLRRESDGRVRFSELSALAYRLAELIDETADARPRPSGRALLETLAAEAGVPADAGFIGQGLALLRQMRASAVLLGTVPAG